MNTVTERLLNFAQKDPWVATDQPFEAFQAGLLVLPELVVFSVKKGRDEQADPGDAEWTSTATRRPGQAPSQKDPLTPLHHSLSISTRAMCA